MNLKMLTPICLLLFGISSHAQTLMYFAGDNGKYGYKDAKGNIVIQPKYDEATPFFGGFGKVKLNGKYGFIDKTGKETVVPRYDNTGNFYDGMAPVQLN